MRKAFSLWKRDVHFYTSNAGLKELREEICSYLERKIGVSYDPMQETMVTVGGSEAIDVALRCMLDPGDEVLIPQPSYVSYLPCTIMADGVPVIIPLQYENEFKLTVEDLKKSSDAEDKSPGDAVSEPIQRIDHDKSRSGAGGRVYQRA